ncbi:MAG: PKD domain-containing protein, partial [Bacteroidales bacterium]|nr:PKD domain-containing protein [Bacteroidales bacterium]
MVKNHLWIDNSPTSPHEGNVYNAWTPFGGTNDTEIEFSRTTNEGISWSNAINISSAVNAGSHNQGVNIQTGPNGEVYVVWTIYDSWPTDEDAMGMAISADGGSSFSPATRIISNIRGIRNTGVSKNMRVNSFPSMAVDISTGPNSGNIYLVWSNVGVPGTNTGTNISAYMIRSTNGGSSWSTPVRVNQYLFQNGKEAYFPWITCDPTSGTLAVVFYDDRNTSSSKCETFVALSYDAGNTWEDFKVSDVEFTPSAIPGLASGYFGDYLSISARDGMFYPCWTDNRSGVPMTYVSPFSIDLGADFSGTPTTVCIGGSVTFTDNSVGNPTSWNWSFPGGTPNSHDEQTPPPIFYNTGGSYNVILTVSDGTSNNTETKPGYITVQEIVADFSGTPTTIVEGNSVTFTDNSQCNPTSWNWTFVGGSPLSFNGQNPPPIVYNAQGSYEVSLTVSDGTNNDTETIPGYITVTSCIYCIPTYSTGTSFGDYISLVQLETINNSTGASSSPYYEYYNNLSTDLEPDNSYTLIVSAGTYGSCNYITAWIYFNRNCAFEEAEMLARVNLGAMPETGTMNFTVPSDAMPGITRMRVREVWNTSTIDPCIEYTYGETEDYNINILSSGIELNNSVLLEGPYDASTNLMSADLNPAYLPLSQPY